MPSLTTHDAELHYDDAGRGPEVLFLQGVGIGRCAWSPQVRGLEGSFRCVAVDHRGIGGSTGALESLSVDRMARDALALVDGLGIERVHVVGHSLGGVVAQRFALLAPERTRSLSLLCTFAGGRDLARPSMRLVWLGLRTRLGTRAMRRGAFARLVMPDAEIEARGLEAVAKELEAVFGRSLADAPPIGDRQLAALREHDERERLSELARVPTFVASGRFDPIATVDCGRRLAAAIPGARFREWENASHALPIQLPGEINDALRAHFEASALTAAA
ncbi:MAG: alpha/beta fold hydrolase [Deltaproteobacteria bacterium]|nr:alpha/beta fold hydrolase [Deltaproteobacteria bacterium]